MKITEFSGNFKTKLSPYVDNMAVLVNKARELVDSENIQVRQVPISKILFTQPLDSDSHESVEEFSQYDSLPFAVMLDGFYHLLDGHHRIKNAIDEGNTRVLLFVADADEDVIEEKKKKQSTHSPIVPFSTRWWYGGPGWHNQDEHNDDITSSDPSGADFGSDGGGE